MDHFRKGVGLVKIQQIQDLLANPHSKVVKMLFDEIGKGYKAFTKICYFQPCQKESHSVYLLILYVCVPYL